MSVSTDLPLGLLILRTVESFKELPRGLLYDKVPASNTAIDEQLRALAEKGAVKIENDMVKIGGIR
ncbi:MAG: hypothetical protein K2Z80_00295 [Xanthobacteraceae bacterium]|nr:hypothetical protein [Xanthobacteraceae bacterium]